MRKIMIVKILTSSHEDSYSYDIVGAVPTTQWTEVTDNEMWLLRKHLDRGYRIIEDESVKIPEFLAMAKEKEKALEEKKLADEVRQKKAEAKRKANAIEKKKKQLEKLKRELGDQ